MNPTFFEGTVVEDAARRELQSSGLLATPGL